MLIVFKTIQACSQATHQQKKRAELMLEEVHYELFAYLLDPFEDRWYETKFSFRTQFFFGSWLWWETEPHQAPNANFLDAAFLKRKVVRIFVKMRKIPVFILSLLKKSNLLTCSFGLHREQGQEIFFQFWKGISMQEVTT